MRHGVGPEYGFGLYVHWPYCARICPYCDFNVYAAKNRDNSALLKAILNDIKAHRTRLPNHPTLDSVFLGGGTPSLLADSEIEQILETASQTFGLRSGAEITLEANPNDVLRCDTTVWSKLGINRLSLGVQSFDDQALTFLGRDHDVSAAKRAIDRVQATFDNHSIDLIYARPGQSSREWQDELAQALAFGAPHLSLYELTIEARTAFGHRAQRGELVPMPDDDQADLFELTQSLCRSQGLLAYEVSNHARAPEFQSRHNLIYWASGDWIGVGPGAHGRLTLDGKRYATESQRRPNHYVREPLSEMSLLSDLATAHEFLAMALRPIQGLELERFRRLFGADVNHSVQSELIENGLAIETEGWLQLTDNGRLIADYIAARLTPHA